MTTATKAPVLIHCMHAPAAEGFAAASGGYALVHWLPDLVPERLLAHAESILAEHPRHGYTSVLVAGSNGHYVAESYTPAGAHIQFCGHGAMAAAWWVLHAIEASRRFVAFTSAHHSWHARRSEPTEADTDIALAYARPDPLGCAVPEFAPACLGSQPVAAATVGDAAGYLVIEVGSALTVQQLQPDLAALGAATGRALIVTARAPLAANAAPHRLPGCVFRYFAPQYGVPEDAATGSAAVQLAAYWSARLPAAKLTLRQLSPQGAAMQVACHADTVELLARVGYG